MEIQDDEPYHIHLSKLNHCICTVFSTLYLDLVLVQLCIVLHKSSRLVPCALFSLQVVVVIVASLYPVLHPFASIIT